jgi:hypothetical protein
MHKIIYIVPLVLALAAGPAYAEVTWTNTQLRGYAEGYSHLPMSFPHDKAYVKVYKEGASDYNFTVYNKSHGGGQQFLGPWPAHSNDNYMDAYRGWWAGDAAYNAPGNQYKCPPGHSAEFCVGYDFGFGIPSNGDAS